MQHDNWYASVVIGYFEINCVLIVVTIISTLFAVAKERDKYCKILDCF
jgi:hypothetical protein